MDAPAVMPPEGAVGAPSPASRGGSPGGILGLVTVISAKFLTRLIGVRAS